MQEDKVNFIGIGAAKCATTWIYRCLLEHPQICGPYEKELNYFSTIDHPLFEGSEKKKKMLFSSGLDSYLECFSKCPTNSIKGEFSTSYISDPGAAAYIKKTLPNVKIIACLRDPVKRAFSFYNFAKDFMMKEKSNTFEEALEKNPEIYIDWGMYHKQLKRYFDIFPKENIGIFLVDDLKKDPVKFMQNIYMFLGVRSNFEPQSAKTKENESSRIRFNFARRSVDQAIAVLYRLKLNGLIYLLKKLGLQKLVHCFHYKINVKKAEKPEINPITEKRMRKLFTEDITKLEELTGRNLSCWKS